MIHLFRRGGVAVKMGGMMGMYLIDRVLTLHRWRKPLLLLFDVYCYVLSNAVCFLLIARSGTPPVGTSFSLVWALLQLALVFGARYVVGVRRNVWRYSTAGVYLQLVVADVVGNLSAFFPALVVEGRVRAWQIAFAGAFGLIHTLLIRFVYVVLYRRHEALQRKRHRTPAVVVGAGHIGSYLADDFKNNPDSDYELLFFIDEDPAKIGKFIGSIPIYSPEEGIKEIKKRGVGVVIATVRSDDSHYMMSIYNRYAELGCQVKVCDTLVREGEERPRQGEIRSFRIEDILFRQPIDLIQDRRTTSFYRGKTVLITGGGGSIGSELCRQVAANMPKRLVIFDIYENNAYDIQQELTITYGDTLDLAVEVGSVRDQARLDEVFERYRPDVVFHAAAHKHVPLMEHCGAEAVKNNVLGTYYTANVAEKYGVERFILISTDKAVNPTNIMGASKRLCEMIVQCRAQSRTRFAAVRFGNVLGSNGSVVPLFQRQIAEGGPVTITDKRITRYFMTITEASQLVLQAGAMAHSGELFVLDMGKPVHIYDLAISMIRLSGLVPGKDIQIKEIGLRPGEKLYEELLMKNEVLDKTDNDLIFIERDARYTREEIRRKIEYLTRVAAVGGDMRKAFAEVVPTYHLPEKVNGKAEEGKGVTFAAPA